MKYSVSIRKHKDCTFVFLFVSVYHIGERRCRQNDRKREKRTEWKLLILYELADGPKRFKELRDTNQNISAKVLTESIQDLMNEGLIVRISYPEVPPRVNYFLSKNGKSLIPLIREMLVWGTEHQKYRSKWAAYGKSENKQRRQKSER